MSISPMLVLHALQATARMSTVAQILIFLPLTLATLGQSAFLSLSLLLTIHSLIHNTMDILLPGLQKALPFLQVPLQPVFLLLIFNLYTAPWQALLTAASAWGAILRFAGPLFIGFEGLASLIVLQQLGRNAAMLIDRHENEGLDFGFLVGSAVAYVLSAWWVTVTYPYAATSPLASTLLGASITALIFLTLIGFALRKTNVIESSGMALYLAYNVWMCSDRGGGEDLGWLDVGSGYSPLLENILPHLQVLLNFIMHTIPKPTLVTLAYRLAILNIASTILPSIGANVWEDEDGVDGVWEGRPSQKLTNILLAYRQVLLIAVYSHLLMLDSSAQIWWRWTNILFTFSLWAVEIVLAGEGGGLGEKWKVE